MIVFQAACLENGTLTVFLNVHTHALTQLLGARTHTYTCTCMRTHLYIQVVDAVFVCFALDCDLNACTHVEVHAYTHTRAHTQTHTHTHTMYTHSQWTQVVDAVFVCFALDCDLNACTHVKVHAYTHTHTHAHTHAHTHEHTLSMDTGG